MSKGSPKGFYKIDDNQWVDEDSFLASCYRSDWFTDLYSVTLVGIIVFFLFWPDTAFPLLIKFLKLISKLWT